MKNILFYGMIEGTENGIIISAANYDRACDFAVKEYNLPIEKLRVEAITKEEGWFYGEVYFDILGEGPIQVDYDEGVIDWNNFLITLKNHDRVRVNIEHTFVDGPLYYGMTIDDLEDLQEKHEYDITSVDDVLEALGIDYTKITLEQADKVLSGDISLLDLKEQVEEGE
ncbi:MAG: hypothetical protein AB7E61_06255 [Acholeplasmataceae bacterium]